MSDRTLMRRVGHNHIYMYVYGVHAVISEGKSPNIRSYTVYIYGVYALFFRKETTKYTVLYGVYIRCVCGIL